MKNYIQRGEVLDFTVPSATTVTSGQIVSVGSIAGVAVTGGNAGDVIAVQLEGVFKLPKATGAINVGTKVYVNATGEITTAADDGATPTPVAHVAVGYAFETVASGAASVSVKLSN
jgi:predicted RecA/RadA family phage recombinase